MVGNERGVSACPAVPTIRPSRPNAGYPGRVCCGGRCPVPTRGLVFGPITELRRFVPELVRCDGGTRHTAYATPSGVHQGLLTAATLLAEIGEDGDHHPTVGVLLTEAGLAPVTRSSGRSHRVGFRYAANTRLREACMWWPTTRSRPHRGDAPPTTTPEPAGSFTTAHCADWATAGCARSGVPGPTAFPTTRRGISRPVPPTGLLQPELTAVVTDHAARAARGAVKASSYSTGVSLPRARCLRRRL
jgi:hypothetical protein